MNRKMQIMLLGATMLLLAAISVSLYVFHAPQRRVLFFLTQDGDKVAELHFLPRKWSTQEQLQETLRELLLGPISVNATALFPTTTKLKFLIVKNTTVYIDLSADAALYFMQDFDAVQSCLIESIQYNFPFISHIVLTIGGQVAEEVPFTVFVK